MTSTSSIATRFILDTVEGKFVIAHLFSRHEGITKEWLYTAITRAADLHEIYFLAQSLYDENMQR